MAIYRFWDVDTQKSFEKHGRTLLDILCSDPAQAIFYDFMEGIVNPRVDKAVLVPNSTSPDLADLYFLVQPGAAHVAPHPCWPYKMAHMVIEGVKPGELPTGPSGFGIVLPWERRDLYQEIDLNPHRFDPRLCDTPMKLGVLLGLLDGGYETEASHLGDVHAACDYDSIQSIGQRLIQKMGNPIRWRLYYEAGAGDDRRDISKLVEFWCRDVDLIQLLQDAHGHHVPVAGYEDHIQTWATRTAIMWYAYRVQMYLYHGRQVPALRHQIVQAGDRASHKRIARRAHLTESVLLTGMETPGRLSDTATAELARAMKIPREYLRCQGRDLYYFLP